MEALHDQRRLTIRSAQQLRCWVSSGGRLLLRWTSAFINPDHPRWSSAAITGSVKWSLGPISWPTTA